MTAQQVRQLLELLQSIATSLVKIEEMMLQVVKTLSAEAADAQPAGEGPTVAD